MAATVAIVVSGDFLGMFVVVVDGVVVVVAVVAVVAHTTTHAHIRT